MALSRTAAAKDAKQIRIVRKANQWHQIEMRQMMDSSGFSRKLLASDLQVVRSKGWLSRRAPAFQDAILDLALARDFDAGAVLYRYGDPAEGLFFVVSGAVMITVPADDGQESVAHREQAGFWVGDLAALAEETRLVTLVATAPTRTLFVPMDRVAALVEATPRYYREFYALSHENMQTALRILANLAVARADHRLTLRLLHLDEQQGRRGAWIAISQEELAAMVAVSVPTLQRALRRLSEAGLTEHGYGKIRVLDRAALIAFCQA